MVKVTGKKGKTKKFFVGVDRNKNRKMKTKNIESGLQGIMIIFLSCSSFKGTDYSDDSDYIEDKEDKTNERKKTEKKRKKKSDKLSRSKDDGSKEDIRMSILKKVFKIKKTHILIIGILLSLFF